MSDNQYCDVHIETTLPKPWEQEESFNDVLYNWMSRAPWLLISGALHFVIFLIVAAIPWSMFVEDKDTRIKTQLDVPPEEPFEEPPEEEIEEIEEEENEEEPIVEDYEVSDHSETNTNEVYESSEGDPDMNADSPFDNKAFNDVLGIGGGAGGKYGGRMGGNKNLRAANGLGTEQALKDGLEWLKNHQDEDGKWDCDEFMKHDPPADRASRPLEDAGEANHDVGVTGLALLAFLGDGNTMRVGPYKDNVSRAMKWLREQQEAETGLIGDQIGHAFLYDHGIATLAVCEAYYFDKSPLLKGTAQKAINFVTRARNPYGAWRYDVPPIGDNDTSVTGWMVFALKSAEEGGLKIDPEAFNGAKQWFNEVSDAGTGRCGYDSPGSLSSRVPGRNEQYPAEKGEAMTSVALLCRFFLGEDPDKTPIMKAHAELMMKCLPKWEPDAKANDMYYWYYGSYAMYQMGGRYWEQWNKAMKDAVLKSQRQQPGSTTYHGSWDPVGPWGWSGGRVYSTALGVLCLEVYFRYGRVLGAR